MRTFVFLVASFALAGAAQAQAPQAETRPAMVFFDWGKTEVTRDGTSILDALAQAYQPGTTLVLTGFSDRSGPASANLRTSRVRAGAVRDYLIAKGVPASAIQANGVGESGFIIPTEDGVREVQNRRVEIRIDQP